MVNFRQIEAFRNVLLTGSVTKTAKAMNITQPAVSRLLKDFAKETGLPLFEREGTGLKPTDEAKQLFQEVNRAFVGMDSIMQTALQIRQKESVELSISAISTVSINLVPDVVRALLRKFGDHRISINTLSSPEILSQVDRNVVDLGIVEGPVSASNLTVERLPPVLPQVFMPRGHRLTKKKVITVEDFHEENFVALPRHLLHRVKVDGMFAAYGIAPRMVVEARSTLVAARLISLGIGIGILDPFVSKTLKDEIDFRPLDVDLQYEYVVVYNRDKQLSKQERYFCDYVHDMLKGFSINPIGGKQRF